jgi:flagellar hook-length control protein FliK
MTLAAIETPSRTAPSKLAETPGSPSSRSEGGEFGQIMSNVMQPAHEIPASAAGQEMAAMAAQLPGFPGAFDRPLGGDFLKAIHLGPNMNVITSEATVPDEQSLEAFARSQGLDETAVQWLMGTHPPVVVAPPTPDLTLTPSSGQAALPAVTATTITLPNEIAASALEAASAAITAPTANTTPAAITAVPAGIPSTAITAPTAGTTAASPAPSTVSADATGTPDFSTNQNALTATALWAMTQSTKEAHSTKPAQEDPSDTAKVQINLMASAAPAAIWMLRNPLAIAPSKAPVNTPDGIALSEIDLTQLASPELLETLSQSLAEGGVGSMAGEHPTPLSGHSSHRLESATTAHQPEQSPDASASAPESSNAQRSENVQNLAEKMGQAVGQRILSEIEKGQWHLKLSLRPATLGHIEVEMRMRSGELDAVFTAPQALTRELLQDGMSKLKDTLNQMGMDVASMQVGDGQTRQRGGESTPGQMSKSTNGNSDDSKSSPQTVAAPAPRLKMGQDGWDVLV